MRRDITVRSAAFAGATDLTIVAPIRKGMVPALDAVTYKTRVIRVLRGLHLGRQTAHEYDLARVMSDAVDFYRAVIDRGAPQGTSNGPAFPTGHGAMR